ncbi:MAG: aconitate hydratase, partial [Desulfohalobiaceae bacterium]|nr:aconitate hydratase [Desulfohalobiaceae bacterium]
MTGLVHKIIKEHLVSGEMVPGSEVGISIDNTLMHDATGQMAMLQFEALGFPEIKTKRSLTYTDHNTLQIGFENMDDHHFLASGSRRFGMHYSRAGNG